MRQAHQSAACFCVNDTLRPGTHWRQSRKDVQHSGDKVDRVGDNVDQDKLSSSCCCRFVAKTGNKVDRIRRQSTLLPICRRFRQQTTFSKVDSVEFNFVASVYRALQSLQCFLQEDRLEQSSACQYPDFYASGLIGTLYSTFSVRILCQLFFNYTYFDHSIFIRYNTILCI